jgi:hypothetical protein
MAYPNPNISTSGATFAQLQAGGLSNLLERLLTVNGGGTAAPTSAPTLAASSSGNSLAAATYYCVITETNGVGETTASPVSSSQLVTTGEELTVTFPILKTGNSARNVYLSTVASAGPFALYATGVTTSTFNCTVAQPMNSYAVAPPTVNSTAFTFVDPNGNAMNFVDSNIRAAKDGNLQQVYKNAAVALDRWLRGDPISSAGIVAKLRHAHAAFAVIAQAFADAGTLVDANAGTLKPAPTGIGGMTTTRTWP